MDLFNPKTGQVETDLDPQNLLGYIEQGYHVPSVAGEAEGQRLVNLLHQGAPVDIPLPDLHGYLKSNPEARLRTKADELMNTGALIDLPGANERAGAVAAVTAAVPGVGPLSALTQPFGAQLAQGIGAASGMTLGFSDTLLSVVAPELLRAAKDVHGSSKMVGELAGVGASMALSGGTTGAARLMGGGKTLKATKDALKTVDLVRKGAAPVARAAAPVGKAAPKAVSLLPTRLGMHWSERAGAAMTRELAKKAAGMNPLAATAMQVGARGAGFAGIGALEGATWGLSQALEEEFLGDPREFGDILAANMGSSAVLGGLLGGGLGALGGLAAGGGAVAQRLARRGQKMAQEGDLQALARDTVVDDLGTQLGLNAENMRLIQNRERTIPHIFDDALLPDGSIISKRGPTGEMQLVSKNEFHKRMEQAVTQATDTISAGRMTMQQAADSMHSPAALDVLSKNVDEIQRAFNAATDAGEKSLLAQQLGAARRSLKDALDGSAWISADDIGASIDEALKALPLGDAGKAARNTLQGYKANYNKLKFLSWDEAFKQRNAFRKAFEKADMAGSDTAKIAQREDSAEGLRQVWRSIDEAMWKKVDKFAAPETAAQWRQANDIYSHLRALNVHLKKNLNRNAPSAQISKFLGYLSNVMGWKTAAAGAQALGKVPGAFTGAGVGGLIGATMGGPLGAVGGAVAGGATAFGLRRALTFKPFTWAQVGRKVATNDHLLQHADNLVKQVDDAVGAFLGGQKGRMALTPVIGSQVVSQIGGQLSPRKRRRLHKKKAAEMIQRRVSALMNNHQQLSKFLETTAGPLQQVHPQTGTAYANATVRQLGALQGFIQQVMPAEPDSLQPALEGTFEQLTDRQVERLGLGIAAITDPGATMRDILSGAATPEQVQLLRTVNPVVFALTLKALARRLSQHKQKLTPHQRAVLASLGLADSKVPPGFIQRAQASYEANRQGMQQPGQGMEPGNNAMGDLTKTGDIYGTRDTARHREDSAAV